MAADAARICRLWETLESEKGNFNTLFQEITDYVLPYHSEVTNTSIFPGRRRGVQRYDATAPDSAEKLASSLGTTLTNPSLQWFDLRVEPEEFNDLPGVAPWLEVARERMNAAFSDSNFYPRIDESWLGLVGYGTQATFIQERFDSNGVFAGLTAEAWPIREYVFLEGTDGTAEKVLRMFKLTPQQAFGKFSQLSNFRGLGPTVERAREAAGTDVNKEVERFEFVHQIAPRRQRNGGSLRSDQMPIESVYVSRKDKHIVAEGGFVEMPVAVARWRKNADDSGWGRGPGINALPDVRSLNETERLFLKAMAKDVDPPLRVEHRGVIGSVRTQPNGINFMRRGAQMDVLQSAGRFDWTIAKHEDRRNQVRRMFLVDQLERLFGEPTPNMTAFEFGRRLDEMRRLLGSTFGRLQREMLDILVNRTFGILLRNGWIPRPPDAIASALLPAGGTIRVEYTGPLAKAQRLQSLDSIQRAYEFATFIAQSTGDMSAMDALNPIEAMKTANDLLGVPQDVQRTTDEIEELAQRRQQQVQEQQQLDQATQAADVLQKAAAGQR